MPGVDKISTQDVYWEALKRNADLDKKIVKVGKFNELPNEDLILSINPSFFVGKVVFGLVKNHKSEDFLVGN